MVEHTFQVTHDRFWYNINDAIIKKGGIYILYSKNNGDVVPIDRLLGVDENGVLYIGMASSYLDRVIELKKSLSPEHNSSGHECGYRWKNHAGVKTKYPYESLHVMLIESDDPRSLESSRLKAYEEKFGELPPLNRMQ